MAVAMKVTRGQIEKALEATSGTVSRAAAILGMARKNLYIRMAHLGIHPDTYRRNSGPSATVTASGTASEVTDGTRRAGSIGSRGAVSVFPNDTLRHSRVRRTLGHVNSAEAVADQAAENVKKLRQARSLYLRPDQWKEVDDACFDLAAKRREKQSPSRVEERFHDRYFAKFVAEELSAGKAARGKKNSKNGGGNSE
jgi:hypothetical protein